MFTIKETYRLERDGQGSLTGTEPADRKEAQ